jgi:hypothetical protein
MLQFRGSNIDLKFYQYACIEQKKLFTEKIRKIAYLRYQDLLSLKYAEVR